MSLPPPSDSSVINSNRNQASALSCLSNLRPTSVTAYNNKDLIPNGFIDQVGITARSIQNPVGGSISYDKILTTLLPSDRIYVEFWYNVRTKSTGTRIQDQGNLSPFGLLGGGAGNNIISAIGLTRIGDIEPIKSNWTYHICESETKLNREFVLSESDFIEINKQKYARIVLPDYILGVLGVTVTPIEFVTPSTDLTDEQKSAAAAKTPDEIYKALGFPKAPSELTDTEIRIILGLPTQIDELGSLGNPSGTFQAWPRTFEGGIRASYKNYEFDSPQNLFYSVDRDRRKNLFRSDNEVRERDQSQQGAGFSSSYNVRSIATHSYTNRSIDDISDKAILINTATKFTRFDDETKKDEEIKVNLKPGDKVYVSYVGGKPILRQGIETDMRFYLFGQGDVGVLPPNDYVKTWNFKKYPFRLPKDDTKLKITIYELWEDYDSLAKINEIQSSQSLSNNPTFAKRLEELQKSLKSFEVEGQRLCETKVANGVVGKPFIQGCYFVDARGFCSCNFKNNEVTVLVPYSEIRDIATFDRILNQITTEASKAYNGAGIINIEEAKKTLFDDFYFDVDEFINTMYTDNEKYGYERRFANSIKQFQSPQVQLVEEKTSTGKSELNIKIAPNTGICYRLDLVKASVENKFGIKSFEKFLQKRLSANDISNAQEWALRLDLFGAKFESVVTNGRPSNLACNPRFFPDGLTGTNTGRGVMADNFGKGSITADALMRTAEIVPDDRLSTKTRIYVETFQLYNPLRKNGGIWVGTKPFTSPNFSVATDKYNNYACVAYADSASNALKYRIFQSDIIVEELKKLDTQVYQSGVGLPADGNELPNIDFAESSTTINNASDKNVNSPGFDNILGDRPGYYRGKEIYLHELNRSIGLTSEQKTILDKNKHNRIILYNGNRSLWQTRNRVVSSDGTDSYFITVEQSQVDYILSELGKNIYLGQITIKGALVFTDYEYASYIEQGDIYNAQKITDKFGKDEARFISIFFPGQNKLIDQISIDFSEGKDVANGHRRANFEIRVDTDYIKLQPFQLRQRPSVFIDNLLVFCDNYLFDDEYEILKVDTQKCSVCFDVSQNIYIFYEDSRASNRLLEGNGRKHDGTHVTGFEGPGFSDVDEVEISCLVSTNLGAKWFDYKAVVRTKYKDVVGNPYVYCDLNSNNIHLFYTINGNLMHKIIDVNNFQVQDASLGYKRPLALNENTPQNYGLYHFSSPGITLRSDTSYVAIGNATGRYLTQELEISALRQAAGYSDIRFRYAGEDAGLDQGFANVDFFAYKNKTGQFNLMYALNGKLYNRKSNNNGISWFVDVDDISIHKHIKNQEYRAINKLGFGYDFYADNMYITYISDGMLFLRFIDGKTYSLDDRSNIENISNLQLALDPDSDETAPIFITGLMPEDILPQVSSGGNHFIFPYYNSGEWNKFADKRNPVYAVSDFQCLGYPLNNGLMRFFYIDYYGNLQGFTYNRKPILDIIYIK